MLPVEVVYAPVGAKIMHARHEFVQGMTVGDALAASDVYQYYPETQNLPVGVFSQKVTVDTSLKPGDRVEIYRPLSGDPKEKRRKRAKKR